MMISYDYLSMFIPEIIEISPPLNNPIKRVLVLTRKTSKTSNILKKTKKEE